MSVPASRLGSRPIAGSQPGQTKQPDCGPAILRSKPCSRSENSQASPEAFTMAVVLLSDHGRVNAPPSREFAGSYAILILIAKRALRNGCRVISRLSVGIRGAYVPGAAGYWARLGLAGSSTDRYDAQECQRQQAARRELARRDVTDLSGHFVATLTGSHCETSHNAHNLSLT